MASNTRTLHFVGKLAEEHKCSICTGLLETPVLTECCGQHFCKECMEKWLTRNNTCPHCRAEEFNKIVNKPLSRKIDGLKVYCSYKENGCKIIVPYSELEKHENDCPFEMVTCPNDECSKDMLKKDLEDHLSQECDYRTVHCQLCDEEGEYWYITESHIEHDCPEAVISCSNKCGIGIKRKDKDSHEEVCPLERVDCPFSEAGCRARVARKDLDEHLATSLQQHLSLTLLSHLQLKNAHKDLKDKHVQLEVEHSELQVKHYELQVKHYELQGKYDMVLSSVAGKLQSTCSPQEQLADIGKCIQPFLHILKLVPLGGGSNIITLQFSKIGCKPLKTDLVWEAATPPFYVDCYSGCRIYITYQPLTLVMELLKSEAAFPPDEVINRLQFSFPSMKLYILRDNFLPWEEYPYLFGERKFRFSKCKHPFGSVLLKDIRSVTVDISLGYLQCTTLEESTSDDEPTSEDDSTSD